MRVLFTGATSFTGMWFVRELHKRGHQVVAASRAQPARSSLRGQRVQEVEECCFFVWGAPFGSDAFLEAAKQHGPFDVLCHHGAETTNYKDPSFNCLQAVCANASNLDRVLATLKDVGCSRVVLTGSVFEADEGAGSAPLRAFSPYGLSKTLTSQIFRFYCERFDIGLGKFVIANPFGPFEEPRLTDYLLRCWTADKPAHVATPAYVRDNIPISLLAIAYAEFVETLSASGFKKVNPSFYVETQRAFTERFAREIGKRLDLSPRVTFADQTEFSEPLARINTDPLMLNLLGWSEAAAWADLAAYYAKKFGASNRKAQVE